MNGTRQEQIFCGKQKDAQQKSKMLFDLEIF